MSDFKPDENTGFNDPDYYLLRESEARIRELEEQVSNLREQLLVKLKGQIKRTESKLKRCKSERKSLKKALKAMEAEGNTSIVAQSDFLEVARPLMKLEVAIAELDALYDSLKDCNRQLKQEKRDSKQAH